jgi:hypothetical protein
MTAMNTSANYSERMKPARIKHSTSKIGYVTIPRKIGKCTPHSVPAHPQSQYVTHVHPVDMISSPNRFETVFVMNAAKARIKREGLSPSGKKAAP